MRFIHNHLWPLWAALALVVAIACWFGVPEPVTSVAAPTVAEIWALRTLPDNESKKSADAINARNLWGVVVLANVVPEPVWKIMGIARSGADRFILLAYEGKPVEILKVGDSLPDGAKIAQIDNDRFFVLTDKKKKLAYGIYKNETAK